MPSRKHVTKSKIHSHVYDFPHLFLFTLCLVLLASGKRLIYLIFFAITTTSKETSILLLLVFILHARDALSRRPFFLLIAAQVLVYAAIKTAITLRFMNNPGSFVEFHLHHNLFMEPYSVGQFVGFVMIGAAMYHHWPEKPLFLRRALWIVPPLVVMALFFGNLQEYRVFYEAYPVMALLILHTVADILGMKDVAPLNRPIHR